MREPRTRVVVVVVVVVVACCCAGEGVGVVAVEEVEGLSVELVLAGDGIVVWRGKRRG